MATATIPATDARTAAAWNDYLTLCREATNPTSYREVEAWAWAKLQQTLRRIALTS